MAMTLRATVHNFVLFFSMINLDSPIASAHHWMTSLTECGLDGDRIAGMSRGVDVIPLRPKSRLD